MRARITARAVLTAAALTIISTVGSCGGGGPGTYVVDMLDLTDDTVASTLIPRPGR